MVKTNFTRGFYHTYNFRDHDPILDQIDTLIKDARVSFAQIERTSGVTVSTLRKWKYRQTKRPQFPTVKAVVRAIPGAELGIIYKGRVIE